MSTPTEPEPPEQADPGGDSDVAPDPARAPGDPYDDEDPGGDPGGDPG